MEHYWSGYKETNYNVRQMKNKLQSLIEIGGVDSRSSFWERLLEQVGPTHSVDGRLLWPRAAYEVAQMDHLRCAQRIIWAAFCFHNGVPFGLMILTAHYSGVLKNDDAYLDLMNSWSDAGKERMAKMTNLLTYDRYCQHLASRKRSR